MSKIKRLCALLLCACLMMSMSGLAYAEDTTESIIEKMSLKQKIGQMLMPAFRTWSDGETSSKVTEINSDIASAIKTYGIGGVIMFAENAKSTAAATELICDMQTAAKESDFGIPLLVAVDQEGGYITRLGTGTATCGNMALGATGSTSAARSAAEIIGSELSAEGFNIDFAPVMDVNNNPQNPVIGVRSFSDDPSLAARLGSAFIDGLHRCNIAAALKHFPGHGDTATDSHTGLPLINKSLKELEACELVSFKKGIESGAEIIMTAHIQYPQIEDEKYVSIADGSEITLPATLSKKIMTDVLRKRLGFDGVICTDAMNMSAIAMHFDPKDAARLAINAGVDILLMPVTVSDKQGIADLGEYINDIAEMVEEGEISESTINSAVGRILRLKSKLNLFSLEIDKEAQVKRALETVGSKENHDAEWKITEKAITAVKNKNMLPISVSENSEVSLFVAYSDEVNSAEYAIERLKSERIIPQSAECNVYCYQKMTELTDEFKAAVKNSDAVVASVESSGFANLNPESSSGWQSAFLDKLIADVHENNKKIAVISLQVPYDLARFQSADALLAAYSCKGMNTVPEEFNGETETYGANIPAAFCAAFGAFDTTGKLPVDVPKLNEDYTCSDKTLYARGFGISILNKKKKSSSGGLVASEVKIKEEKSPEEEKTPEEKEKAVYFADVPEGSFYAEAINWAAESGIATGTSENMFSPSATCTRAQALTFLWRIAGCPQFEKEISFKDVSPDAYYAEAVKWGIENGITLGTSKTAFSPDAFCTRAQMITFIWRVWRAAGSEPAKSKAGFEDVAEGSYCFDAVNWAAENGIVEGIGKNVFAPDALCTRAQMIMMLYRAK